ncbi:hypothetical protein ACN47E_000375 [Coniothyrium glycines]
MSHDSRSGAQAYGAFASDNNGGAKKGSVRAARERLRAEQQRTQRPDTSRIIGLPQRPNQLMSQYSSPSRKDYPQRQQQQAQSLDRNEGAQVSPELQWPLPNAILNSNPVLPPRSPKRLQPPSQSMRPISDDYPIQQLSPGIASSEYLQPPSPQYGVPYSNEEMFSPSSLRSARPLTTSSAASEASSLGSIPDFPVPQPPFSAQQQARRLPGLGPPPSSRRGPSSYYTQMSYVSPIVEESETRSNTTRSRHGSFASSNVFPTNKEDFYHDDGMLTDDDVTITSDRGTASPGEQDDRSGLVKQPPALVRQASLGRRTKPSLMTIKSVDGFGDKKGGASKKKGAGIGTGLGVAGAGGAMFAARDGVSSSLRGSALTFGTGSLDASSSSDSVNTLKNAKSKAGAYAGYMSPTSPLQQETYPSGLTERAGMRRPPRLDMDAVRDAEARGSLTSLPDLIRRATRLAANLDRGKTASRLGLDFWEAGDPMQKDVRQSGLSDMLAAFPPPGRETPLRSATPNGAGNRLSNWPSGGAHSRHGMTDSGMSIEKNNKRRSCCGVPMWTFVTLLIVLLFIVAAAIVIPVVLVVIPNQNKSSGTTMQDTQGSSSNNNNSNTNTGTARPPAPTATQGSNQCDGVITCQNGGLAILNSDRSCNCVCINGFTGRTCTNNDATGCTTASVAGTANNATLGSGIPRLLDRAANDFQIPLDATRILTLFSSLSLSCAAENALITFNGLAARSVVHHLESLDIRSTLHPSRTLPVLHHPHPVPAINQRVKRQTVGAPDESGASTEQKSAQSNALQTQPISSNVNSLDFARIGVLLALQESSDLDVAASAQEAIQSFLTNNRNGNAAGTSVDIGPFTMNLVDFTIQFQNGTTLSATPPTTLPT